MDTLIEQQRFVFGRRPSSADFGIYAQLTQLAKFDPTPANICMELAPRVFAWTDMVDDLSGEPALDDAWMAIEEARALLGGLLTEIGNTYAPVLVANAEALGAGQEQMATNIDGKRWEQPVFPYQGKCLGWINEEYQRLNKEAQTQVDEILAGTGCDSLLDAR